jgi:hypothetical protein
MLEKDFPELAPRLAVGLAGRGSECFGYDDEISRDHDYQISLWLWLESNDERVWGFALERAYKNLLKNHPPQQFDTASSLLGGTPRGVCVIEDFFRRHLGIPGAPEHFQEWFNIPEYAFAEAVNDKVFRDDAGTFSTIRHRLMTAMPRDVKLKKLAARAAMMAQSGQYNFSRCHRHNEPGAAALALAEFVKNTISMIFLLNDRFAPYYKWQFRALRQLPKLAHLADDLEILLLRELPFEEKAAIIESIAAQIIAELAVQKSSAAQGNYLEPHAFALMSQITDQKIASLHIMEG